MSHGDAAHAEGYNTTAAGVASHAEGGGTKAEAIYSHAEGQDTRTAATAAHAEGYNTTAIGVASHAEGGGTRSEGIYSHAEGQDSAAKSAAAHAEGLGTVAEGPNSHSEGYHTKSMSASSHAEGDSSAALGNASHAEGGFTSAGGDYSHSEGFETAAQGFAAHAEGDITAASGAYSHAEGTGTTSEGDASHTEGDGTRSVGKASHAEGKGTVAGSLASHAEGIHTAAGGAASHAQGFRTTASGALSSAGGKHTSTGELTGAAIIGKFGQALERYAWHLANGIDEERPGVAAKINQSGEAAVDRAFLAGGHHYAEMFETIDGASIANGYFVTFEGTEGKIRRATDRDEYVLGVTGNNPSVIGNAGELRWAHKYATGEWGGIRYQKVTVPPVYDASGNLVEPEHAEDQPVPNPAWNPKQPYIPRRLRPEWAIVGLLGQVLVRDDGSCFPGGYCRPNAAGIATNAKASSGYRVMRRTGDNQILILFR